MKITAFLKVVDERVQNGKGHNGHLNFAGNQATTFALSYHKMNNREVGL